MTSLLLDPYRSSFMQHAAVMAVVVGTLAPVVGVWVVLRRLAYLGDAMSHGTLVGVAGAYLTGVPVVLGALVSGVGLGGLVALLDRRRRVGQDSAIGVVGTLLFSLGVLLVAGSDGIGIDLGHFLFGQLVTVDGVDLLRNGALAAAAVAAVALSFSDLRDVSFDPLHAAQVGIPCRTLQIGLFTLVAVAVVVSLDTVGLLMTVSMLVTPASAARLWCDRVATMTVVAVGVGVSSALGGLTLAYHLATPPGPTIALVAAGWFLLATLLDRT